MADSTIGLDLDLVTQNLLTLIGLGDVIPPAGEVSVAKGLSSGPGAGYHAKLVQRGQDLATLVVKLRTDLENAHDAIQETVNQFIAQDAAQAQIANDLMASIDSMAATDTGSTTGSSTSGSSSSSDARTALG
jgi:hypothetical protein